MKLYVPDGKGGRTELKVLRGDPGPQGNPGPPGKDGVNGQKGDKGDPGTTTWAGITDKPEVTDLDRPNTIVQRSESGTIRAADPQGANNVTTQRYVNQQLAKKADTGHTHSEYAPRNHTHSEYATRADLASLIRVVSSPPSSPTSGVLYVVPEE